MGSIRALRTMELISPVIFAGLFSMATAREGRSEEGKCSLMMAGRTELNFEAAVLWGGRALVSRRMGLVGRGEDGGVEGMFG